MRQPTVNAEHALTRSKVAYRAGDVFRRRKRHAFTVSSPDFMDIYAANNLVTGIQTYSNKGGGLLCGVIANSYNTDFHREILDEFVARTETQVVEYVPRSLTVAQAELQGKTPIDAAPKVLEGRSLRRLTGCIPDLAGDDVARRSSRFSSRARRSCSSTGDFHGSNFTGHERSRALGGSTARSSRSASRRPARLSRS
jgi:hypothetical protein